MPHGLRRSPAPPIAVPRPLLFESHPTATAVYALRMGACRYPIGNPGEASFRFCASPVWRGRSYCERCYRECVDRLVKAPRLLALGHGTSGRFA